MAKLARMVLYNAFINIKIAMPRQVAYTLWVSAANFPDSNTGWIL
jgi:hypothetical protein